MKTKTFLLTCIIVLYSVFIYGQNETTEWWFLLEQEAEHQVNLPFQNVKTTSLKLVNYQRFYDDNFLLGLTLQRAIEKGDIPIYKNKSVGTSYSSEEVKEALYEIKWDTAVVYDMETFEEEIQIIQNEESLFPTSKTAYQLEQYWSFDEDKQELNQNLTAINIGHWQMAKNDFINTETLKADFTIKNKAINSQLSIEQSSVTWAKTIYTYGTFYDRKLREAIFSKKHLSQHKIVNAWDYDFVLSESDIETTLRGEVDTVMDYKPHEINPKITVVTTENRSAAQITTFRIVQDIYFDSQLNAFQTKILAIAPSIEQFDDGGNFQYYSPLFWIVYDDDFLKGN